MDGMDSLPTVSREKIGVWLRSRMNELARDRIRAAGSENYLSAGVFDARHAELYGFALALQAGDFDGSEGGRLKCDWSDR